jgi:hypothetical protein
MPKGIELAAPQGYWFDNEGVMTPSKECHGTSNFYDFNQQSEFQYFAWREVLLSVSIEKMHLVRVQKLV